MSLPVPPVKWHYVVDYAPSLALGDLTHWLRMKGNLGLELVSVDFNVALFIFKQPYE